MPSQWIRDYSQIFLLGPLSFIFIGRFYHCGNKNHKVLTTYTQTSKLLEFYVEDFVISYLGPCIWKMNFQISTICLSEYTKQLYSQFLVEINKYIVMLMCKKHRWGQEKISLASSMYKWIKAQLEKKGTYTKSQKYSEKENGEVLAHSDNSTGWKAKLVRDWRKSVNINRM